MELISLSVLDLSIAAILVILLAILSWHLKLGIQKPLLIAATRSVIQLTLLGLILKQLFNQSSLLLIGLISLVMLVVAGYEVMARQSRRYSGWWGMGIGTSSMFLSSFSITLLALFTIVRVDPWYTPQYLIPLLGMLLGNTMNGISVALNNLSNTAYEQRGQIEARVWQ